ncbi:MAG: RND transporter [Hirschia sp.]|nr:RND transporter [Hirschia sp.]MBF19772.1 RND transporter [Hirschia sp.]
MQLINSRTTSSALVCLILAGCVTIPTTPTESILEVPAAYDEAQNIIAETRSGDDAWISLFQIAPLNELIDQANANNLDLEAGLANLRAAEASLKSARAGLLPSVTAGASSSGSSEDDFSEFNSSARLSAAYSLDLFGQTKFSVLSAREGLNSQQFSQRALELTVKTNTASAYLTLTSLRNQMETAQANLEISQRIYDLVKVRYDAGAVSGFDLESQKASLANARARIPQLDQQITAAETSLALLLGRSSQGFEAPIAPLENWAVPHMPVGMPSDLLVRRPDLLSAEADLRAANANIAAARAAFYPSVDLSAGVSTLLTSGADIIGSTAASLSAPIFSGGRLAAQTESAIAQRDALVARYEQAAYSAFRDVDIALSSIRTADLREAELAISETASARALELAETRYANGADGLTELLNAQSSYFSARDSRMQARTTQLQAAIDLYAALGGGW